MADIDVVKKGSRAWIWVVLALAVILVLWFVFAGNRNTTQTGFNIEGGGQPLHAAVTVAAPQAA